MRRPGASDARRAPCQQNLAGRCSDDPEARCARPPPSRPGDAAISSVAHRPSSIVAPNLPTTIALKRRFRRWPEAQRHTTGASRSSRSIAVIAAAQDLSALFCTRSIKFVKSAIDLSWYWKAICRRSDAKPNCFPAGLTGCPVGRRTSPAQLGSEESSRSNLREHSRRRELFERSRIGVSDWLRNQSARSGLV